MGVKQILRGKDSLQCAEKILTASGTITTQERLRTFRMSHFFSLQSNTSSTGLVWHSISGNLQQSLIEKSWSTTAFPQPSALISLNEETLWGYFMMYSSHMHLLIVLYIHPIYVLLLCKFSIFSSVALPATSFVGHGYHVQALNVRWKRFLVMCIRKDSHLKNTANESNLMVVYFAVERER